MSLINFTKEQKQYLILGAVVMVVLTVLMVFGIKVSLSSVTEARIELLDLTTKIEGADRVLAKRDQIGETYRHTILELKNHIASVPPDRNYYSWATEIVYLQARMVDLEIDAVDEINLSSSAKIASEDDGVRFESYSLRITAHGGYESIRQFLSRLKQKHPLMRITGIEISTGGSPDTHDVQLFIQWPFNLGYITEEWERISAKQQAVDIRGPLKTERPTRKSKSVAVDKEMTRSKTPVPPPARLESTPTAVKQSPPKWTPPIKLDLPKEATDEN